MSSQFMSHHYAFATDMICTALPLKSTFSALLGPLHVHEPCMSKSPVVHLDNDVGFQVLD